MNCVCAQIRGGAEFGMSSLVYSRRFAHPLQEKNRPADPRFTIQGGACCFRRRANHDPEWCLLGAALQHTRAVVRVCPQLAGDRRSRSMHCELRGARYERASGCSRYSRRLVVTSPSWTPLIIVTALTIPHDGAAFVGTASRSFKDFCNDLRASLRS